VTFTTVAGPLRAGNWTGLVDHLRVAGFTDSELEASGLAIRTREWNLVDRFRDRIMLPIRDGRRLGDRIHRESTGRSGRPNTEVPQQPNTAIYHKAISFSPRFGWVQDRFGVSWQLNLVPAEPAQPPL
jgi:DNA primase catalytic core, N-terminal domain/3-demethylubiquinone-9 3-methyltransferase